MSTPKTIGGSTLQIPDGAENYSLPLLVADLNTIADEVNKEIDGRTRFRHAEYSASTNPGSGAIWDVGYLTLTSTSANVVNNTFSAALSGTGNSGKLNITETGLYQVSVVCSPSASPGANIVGIKDGGDSYYYAINESPGSVKYENSASATIFVPSTPKTIFFRTQGVNGAPFTSIIRIDKITGV